MKKDHENTTVVDEYFVHELAVVEDGAVIGRNSKIWHFAHVREKATLGEGVVVGKSSFIDTKVKIGSNVKIQNLVSIYQGVTIQDDVFVGPHVAFTNDLLPRATGEWEITSTLVKQGASIGANATIICGITIGKHSLIGAGSVVTKNIPDHGLVVGNPARLIGWVCYCAHRIAGNDLESGKHQITCPKCHTTVRINVP